MDLSLPKKRRENNSNVEFIGIEGVSEELLERYKQNYKAHEKGITHEKMTEVYTKWAQQYDQDVFTDGCYNGPEIAAKEMADIYPPDERPNIKVLDIAAGTGKVGVELVKFGFKMIDALEPSRGMLDVLLERKIYGRTYETAIGYKPVAEIRADFYDALVIAGGMGEGHIPISAIDEFIRIVRPGGFVCIIMREEYLDTVGAYKGLLEPSMETLVHKGLWIKIKREIVPNYSFNKNGVVFVYEKVSY